MNNKKAQYFTRCEGGNKQIVDFDITEDELSSYDNLVIKKEVFSKLFKTKIVTRVVKFGNKYIHALFFEDGKIYDCGKDGFRERKTYSKEEISNNVAKEKQNA